LLIGGLVAVLDRIRASVNRSLNADCIDGVDGNSQVLAVSFFDNCL